MPVDFSVRPHGDLKRLGEFLRASGNRELQREVLRAINAATEPIKQDIADEARKILPKRGGLNEFVADARIATRTRLQGRNIGVRIVAEQTKGKSHALRSRAYKRRHGLKSTRGRDLSGFASGPVDLAAINRGRVRHPIYGRWVPGRGFQSVKPGFFSRPIRTLGAQRVKRNTIEVVRVYLEKAARAAGGRAA